MRGEELQLSRAIAGWSSWEVVDREMGATSGVELSHIDCKKGAEWARPSPNNAYHVLDNYIHSFDESLLISSMALHL